jgi:hypothetical protein
VRPASPEIAMVHPGADRCSQLQLLMPDSESEKQHGQPVHAATRVPPSWAMVVDVGRDDVQ